MALLFSLAYTTYWGVLLIGDIVPDRDRRNGATCGSSKSGQVMIGEIEPERDRRNEATS